MHPGVPKLGLLIQRNPRAFVKYKKNKDNDESYKNIRRRLKGYA